MAASITRFLLNGPRFKGDRLATFTCSFGAADRATFSITGTRGSLTMDPAYEYAMGLSCRVKIGERTQTKKFAKSDQFAPELLYFSDCILNDRQPEPSGEEGLLDVRIVEALHRSIARGRMVAVTTAQHKRRRRCARIFDDRPFHASRSCWMSRRRVAEELRRPSVGGTGMKRILRDNGLSLALFGLFLVFWVGQALAGWRDEVDDRRAHGAARRP